MSRRSQFYISRKLETGDPAPIRAFGFMPPGGNFYMSDRLLTIFDANSFPINVPLGAATLFYVEVGVHTVDVN